MLRPANKRRSTHYLICDFRDAHNRHWEDAELLKGESRLPNADHLYGVSAECGLKSLMVSFGMPMSADKPSNREDRIHADGIWIRFDAYRAGYPQGTNFTLLSQNHFSDWSVNDRYAHRADFDSMRLERHRAGAEEVRALIRKAEMDGVL
ncbi:hypothetical protein [Chlorobium limicola]|uniref:Uncharacterized protein n=1 Tax=Chlorobium limicola TaxID=1092 RepID=A0A101J4W6_CHLLI|nr:hypothetical protein [Chlorobium limicola]KUL20235.1 hypothetical protein ASB62_10030 [Chlorobium limicola]